MTDDFVLRPGRTMALWAGKCTAAKMMIASDIAVSVIIEDENGPLISQAPKLEHQLAVDLAHKKRVKLLVTNASGTRKARGSFEVTSG